MCGHPLWMAPYGNKQILISSYMGVLVKLPKADNMKDIDKLKKSYNSLETSVRNFADLGVEITSNGTLLVVLLLIVFLLN